MGIVRGTSHDEVDALSTAWFLVASTSRNGSLLGGSCSWTAFCVVRLPGKVGDPKSLANISFLESLLGVCRSVGSSSSTNAGIVLGISE